MIRSSMYWKALPMSIKAILYIYIICFLAGSIKHLGDIVQGGMFPYKGIPFLFNLFLTSLTLFDLAVIVLLVMVPFYGVILANLIMVSDLLVDFYVGYSYWNTSLSTNKSLQLLVAFGLFVFTSGPLIIIWLKKNT